MPNSLQYPIGIIAVAILAMFVLPAGVYAQSGYEVHPGAMELILPVEKKGDVVISVSGNGGQRVSFVVDGPLSTTEYSTKGRVNSRRIEASFGPLGRINVALHLVRFPSDPSHQGRCSGRSPVYQEGTYRGTIKIFPDGDVPKVYTKRGRVYFERRFRQVCKRQRLRPDGKKEEPKIEVGLLTVEGKDNGRTVLLRALNFSLRREPSRSWGQLVAAVYERNEEVRVARKTSISINPDSFSWSGPSKIPETVVIKLPKPFAGEALYSHSPGFFPDWTGDLSVDLPGTDRISLTGPGFSAALCRGSSVAMLNHCLYRSMFKPQPFGIG